MAEQDSRKFGEGHFMAWIREGFKELAQALEAFPGQGIHHVEEAGLVGNPTPQIVTQEMGASYKDLLREASQRAVPEQERDLGIDR